MYIFDVNILYYVFIIVISCIMGQFVDYSIKTLVEEKKILSKSSFQDYKETFKINYKMMMIFTVLNVLLVFKFKIKQEFFLNLDLIKYFMLFPFLICAFFIDIKKNIIPNRITLTALELGLIIVFLYGTYKDFMAINFICASLMNLGVFLLITIMSKIFLGQEGIGLGDVKLMAVIGLFMGVTNSINIFILSFFIGAFISICLLAFRKTKINDSIPFAPSIVLATIFTAFIPIDILTFLGDLIIK